MDTEKRKTKIEARLAELHDRLKHVEDALDEPADADLDDQAIELEDDEVLEAIGAAAQKETFLLQNALRNIDAGTYGICKSCGDDISPERLDSVPYALLCRKCANSHIEAARQRRR